MRSQLRAEWGLPLSIHRLSSDRRRHPVYSTGRLIGTDERMGDRAVLGILSVGVAQEK